MPGTGNKARLRWRRLLPRRRRGWLWLLLAVGTLLNGLRYRQRLSALSRLDGPGNDDAGDDFVVVHRPGVEVDEATRRSAVAHALAQDLEVLDLVPGNLALDRVLDLARAVDTTTFRSAALAPGRGAGHAVVVERGLLERTDGGAPVSDQASLVRLMERLKQHAARSTDLVVAPGLAAVGISRPDRLGELKALYGGAFPLALAIPAARSSLLLAGVVLSPGWGAAAAAAFCLQPYLVTPRNVLQPLPRSPLGAAMGRFVEPFALLRAAMAARAVRGGPADDPIESRRPYYTEALAAGTERFFEPRRTTCPWCSASGLVERIRVGDLAQFKPGEFVVDECTACGHVFQNPRLSIEGLDFYYRDFYDGLGEGGTEFLFAYSEPSYRGRVELARRHAAPRAWLDVGTGYGHFCLIARGLLPETRFDGLDMGVSVDEGQRRGWLDQAYRGMFPDLADELKGQYDVVSMHHYLEHTRDPRAELRGAQAVLEPGGHLLIEVPDPESRFARLLGRYWLPWFQPQHQELVSVGNLCQALEALGFSIVEVERGPAHQPVDLGGAIWTYSSRWAPPPRLPWRPDPTATERLRRWVTLGVLAPCAFLGVLADRALQPVVRTRAQGWSNTYRVLARRDP